MKRYGHLLAAAALLAGCGDDSTSTRRTAYDLVEDGIIQDAWTDAQEWCAVSFIAYSVRWAECSTEPEDAVRNLEDGGRDLVEDLCIEHGGAGFDERCADSWANDTCEQIREKACDEWAYVEGRMPGEPLAED